MAIDNPSEFLTHVMGNLVPGKWCASIRGPTHDPENNSSVIQVHFEGKGNFYVTSLTPETKALAIKYPSGSVNTQGAAEFGWKGDPVMAFQRAKILADWKFDRYTCGAKSSNFLTFE